MKTWGEIDSDREARISKYDWVHVWPSDGSQCQRCHVAPSKVARRERCNGGDSDQVQAHYELFIRKQEVPTQ